MYATYTETKLQEIIDDINEKVDNLVTQAATAYGLFYNMDVNGIDYSKLININAAANVFKMYPNLIRYMENRRQDLYFSDREINALAYTLYSDFDEIIKQRKNLDAAIRTLYKYEILGGIY